MPDPAPAPAAPPAALPAPTEAAPATSKLDSLFGPKDSAPIVYVHPLNERDGRRLPAVLVIRSDEPEDTAADRLAALKPGTYAVVEKVGGVVASTRSHVVPAPPSDDDPAPPLVAQVAPVHQAGQSVDVVGAIKEMMAGMMLMQQQAADRAMAERREERIAEREARLDLARELGKNSNNGGMPEALMQSLLNRAFAPPPTPADPFEQLERLMNVKKLVATDGEESPMRELVRDVAPLFAGAFAAMAQQRPAAPRPPVRTVAPAPSPAAPPAPAGGDGASGAEALSDLDRFNRLVGLIESMAARQVAPDAALVTLESLVDPEDMEQVASFVTIPGAIDQLLSIAPSLVPYRSWVEALAAELTPPPAGDSDAQNPSS